MTHDDFTVPLATKMTGTLNLDRAFSSPNHHLDFFITLSSVANIVGTRGQANYNAGNAVQDAIPHIMANTSGCHYLTLNVGMVRGTDAVDTHDERNKWLHRSGLKTIDEAQLSGVFEYILSPQARDDRMRQIVMGFDASSLAANESMNGNVRAPMFAHVLGTTEVSVKQAAVTKTRTFKEVRETEGAHDILAFAIAALCAKLSSLLSIDAAAINVNKALVEFGIDSLVAIELRNWIKREFGTAVQSLEILNEGSIKLLAKKIVDRAG
jgi:acyl carrier protein